jgi:signal transduction histidine kinase
MTGEATAPGLASNDFVSLSYRMRSLLVLRCGFAAVAVAIGVAAHGGPVRPGLVVSSALYVALEVMAEVVRRRGRGRRLTVLAFEVLLDGLYLTWITYLTGGVLSPLQSLIYVHVIAISLLASYRTGLKVALWDSLLLLVIMNAEISGSLTETRPLFGDVVATPPRAWVITIIALWGVTIATAALSAVNERSQRRRRADLEALSRTVAALAASDSADEIPGILLDGLQHTFDIGRSLVLASPADELTLIGSRGIEQAAVKGGLDPVVEHALNTRTVQLIRQLDPVDDPRLSAWLPGARNLLVVPLFLGGGFRLGVLVAEFNGRGDRIRGWSVEIIQQFASHCAVRLHNVWLLEENERKLGEIRRLKDQLVVQNLSLESRAIERTEELGQRLEQLRGSDTERQRLLSHLVSAQEGERLRIAGDIHDDPLQLLVAVAMQLDMLRRELADPEQAEHISELREWIRTAVNKLRNLMFEMRPPILDEEGLAAAIEECGAHLNLEQKVTIHDRFSEEPPDEAQVILYRIAQEALANIRKHSHAANVIVTLEHQGRSFLVRMVDDGDGFSPGDVAGTKEGHIGLTAMRERAEMAGGGCRIHSLPGDGTTVEFWVPSSLHAGAVRPVVPEGQSDVPSMAGDPAELAAPR